MNYTGTRVNTRYADSANGYYYQFNMEDTAAFVSHQLSDYAGVLPVNTPITNAGKCLHPPAVRASYQKLACG